MFCEKFSGDGLYLIFTAEVNRYMKGMVLYEKVEESISFASKCLIDRLFHTKKKHHEQKKLFWLT